MKFSIEIDDQTARQEFDRELRKKLREYMSPKIEEFLAEHLEKDYGTEEMREDLKYILKESISAKSQNIISCILDKRLKQMLSEITDEELKKLLFERLVRIL